MEPVTSIYKLQDAIDRQPPQNGTYKTWFELLDPGLPHPDKWITTIDNNNPVNVEKRAYIEALYEGDTIYEIEISHRGIIIKGRLRNTNFIYAKKYTHKMFINFKREDNIDEMAKSIITKIEKLEGITEF